MKASKVFITVSIVLTSVLFVLGALTLLFNLLGKWWPWNAAAGSFILFMPPTVPVHVLSCVFACKSKFTKRIVASIVLAAVTFLLVIFTVSVSMTWFW